MIDLGSRLDHLTEEQRMLRDGAAAFFAAQEDGRGMRGWRGRLPGFDSARWREMAALGWTGLCLPERYGGSGCGLAEAALLLEQCGRALAPEPLIAGALLPATMLLHADNEALQERWLPRLARGECQLAVAWQESRNDQTGVPTDLRARQRGDDLVLDGSKCFVAAAAGADAFVVSAVTPTGPVLLLVEATTPGLSLTTRPRVDGGFWGEVRFQDAAVARGQALASAGRADEVLQEALDNARILSSAELLGVMSRALEVSVEYIGTREQFGRPVGSFQALQHRSVDLLIQVELTRAVVMQSARAADHNGVNRPSRAAAASQAKARASAAALEVTKGCIQLHGGIGYTDECEIGLYLKKAMFGAAWLGTSSWHRQRYGKVAQSERDDAAPQGSVDLEGKLSREYLRRWIAENFPPEWRFPPARMGLRETREWHAKLHAQGWAAPNWPKEHGGMGLSAYEQVALQGEFDRHGIHIAPNPGIAMLGPLLMRFGTESQKRSILPKILSGEVLWCQGYSEPSAGSDLANLRTVALLDGSHFVVNGQKIWTSFAHEADMVFLLVRTDPSAKKQEGISFLLADMRSPGITVNRIRNLGGGAEFCEVFFDNVRVPRENLVGRQNEGWAMAKSVLGSERIMLGNPRLARVPLQRLRDLGEAMGLLEDPVWRARLDQLRMDVDDLDALFVRCLDVLRRGSDLGPEVSMLKIWITEAFQRVADSILETAGESGVAEDPIALRAGPVNAANIYFSARPASIYGGSNEIQRNILAKAVLELPA